MFDSVCLLWSEDVWAQAVQAMANSLLDRGGKERKKEERERRAGDDTRRGENYGTRGEVSQRPKKTR